MREILQRVKELKSRYKLQNRQEGYKTWGEQQYLFALLGDLGDVAKQLMAQGGYAFAKKGEKEKLAKELADCLWGVMALADEAGIDLEREFRATLRRLEGKLSERKLK